MRHSVLTSAAIAAFAVCAQALTPVPACTKGEVTKIKSIWAKNAIPPACPELQLDSDGNADLSDTSYCANAKCVQTITSVKIALPKCKLDGVRVRAASLAMLAACGDGDDDSDATTMPTPTPTTPLTTTAIPQVPVSPTPSPTVSLPNPPPATDSPSSTASSTTAPTSTSPPTPTPTHPLATVKPSPSTPSSTAPSTPEPTKKLTPVRVCTADEADKARSIQAKNAIPPACPELKFDHNGTADLSDISYCANSKCYKTIKSVKISLPKCKLDGVRVRAASLAMLDACGDDDHDSDTTKPPKPESTKKTLTPVPTCTPPEAATVKSIWAKNAIPLACPELKFDSNGNADLSDTSFCTNAKCYKTIRSVKIALPKCKLDGVRVRAAPLAMLDVCGDVESRSSDGKHPQTKKPKSLSPVPVCSPEQANTVHSIQSANAISAACPELQIASSGTVDLSDAAFCRNKQCVKTIQKVKIALPKCKLNGVRVRTTTRAMLALCKDLKTSPKPTKTRRRTPLFPTINATDLVGSEDGSLGDVGELLDDDPEDDSEDTPPARAQPLSSRGASVHAASLVVSSALAMVVVGFAL